MIDTLRNEYYNSNSLMSNKAYQYELCKQLGLYNIIRFKFYHLLLTPDEVFEDQLLEKGFTGKEIDEIKRLKKKIDKVLLIYGIKTKSGQWALNNFKDKGTKRIMNHLMDKIGEKYGLAFRKDFWYVFKKLAKDTYGVEPILQDEKLDIYQILVLLRMFRFKQSLQARLMSKGIIGIEGKYGHSLFLRQPISGPF